MNESNFLQTQSHCLICHQDYFMSHNCGLSGISNCEICKRNKDLEDIKRQTDNYFLKENKKDFSFCPYCGHKL